MNTAGSVTGEYLLLKERVDVFTVGVVFMIGYLSASLN